MNVYDGSMYVCMYVETSRLSHMLVELISTASSHAQSSILWYVYVCRIRGSSKCVWHTRIHTHVLIFTYIHAECEGVRNVYGCRQASAQGRGHAKGADRRCRFGMYVYMYTSYTLVHIYIYIYIYINVYTCIYCVRITHRRMYGCMYIRIWTWWNICSSKHDCTAYIHTYIHTYIHYIGWRKHTHSQDPHHVVRIFQRKAIVQQHQPRRGCRIRSCGMYVCMYVYLWQ